MQDAQFPPDAGDANSTPARRSSLRLSDADVVATTRLDMFGDGSLTKTLAGAPGLGQAPPSAAEASPADPPLTAAAAVDDAQPAIAELGGADAPPQPPLPPPSFPQPLDAGIEPSQGERAAHDLEVTIPNAPPPPQFSSPSPDQAPDPEPGQTSSATATHLEVSPIFSALDAAEKRAVEAEHHGEAPAPRMLHSAFMMPPVSPQLGAFARGPMGPLSEQPRFRDELRRAETSNASLDFVSADEFVDRIEESDAAVAADAPSEAGSATAIDAEPLATSSSETAPDPGVPPFPELVVSPPFPELPDQPVLADPPAGPAYLAPLGVPPFIETSVAADEPSEAPPYSELSPASAPPMLDAAAQIAVEANATAEALENLKRLLAHKLPDLEPAEAAGQFDTASDYTLPPLPPVGTLRLKLQMELPPFAAGGNAPFLPLPIPPERSSGKGIYLLGFLAGLGLSLMAGAALYFYIITSTG